MQALLAQRGSLNGVAGPILTIKLAITSSRCERVTEACILSEAFITSAHRLTQELWSVPDENEEMKRRDRA